MSDSLCELEKAFPHIVRNVVEKWSRRDCLAYIDTLMVDTRGGRQGFPFPVLTEIMLLRDVYVEENGDPTGPANIWYS